MYFPVCPVCCGRADDLVCLCLCAQAGSKVYESVKTQRVYGVPWCAFAVVRDRVARRDAQLAAKRTERLTLAPSDKKLPPRVRLSIDREDAPA